MAYTAVWDEDVPLGSAAANTIDDLFRNLKRDLRERIADYLSLPSASEASFATDPLRPYGLKFTDAADAILSLGDNTGTPRALIVKNKAGDTSYFSFDSTRFDIIGALDIRVNTDKFTVAGATGNTVIAGTLNVTGTITGSLTGDVTGNVSGSAATLSPGRNINGVAFDGSTNITIGVAASDITGVVGETQGGTGLSTYTSGDIIYADGANSLAKLAKGTDGQFLSLSGGFPAWANGSTPDPLTIGTINATTLIDAAVIYESTGTSGTIANTGTYDIPIPDGTGILFIGVKEANIANTCMLRVTNDGAVVTLEAMNNLGIPAAYTVTGSGDNARITNASGSDEVYTWSFLRISTVIA